MTEKELKQLSKDALEELGRTKGIELDKRYNKGKLVKQIAEVFNIEASDTPKPTGGRSFGVFPGDSNA